MSSGGSIQAMITTMKNNASQRKSRTKFKGLDSKADGVYTGKIKEKEFTEEQIQAVKDAFQLQVKAEKKKTIITLIATIVIVPLVIYGLVQLYLYMFI
jgi:hypothetical protein